MKSITKLSLVLLTAMAFAALPANAQSDSTSTNAAPRMRARGFAGTITAVDPTGMILTLKGRTADTTVKVTSDTKITKDREPAVFADAKEGLRVNGAGTKQDDGSWIATTLRISTKVPRSPAPATPAPTTPPPTSDQK
jgi:hypothetical protein